MRHAVPATFPLAPAATLLVALLVALPGPAAAQSKTGTTIGQFLRIEPGARAAGLGNAGAALAEGIEAVWFNPGVIGRLDRSAVSFTHSSWFADIAFDHAAAAVPVAGLGTIYGSVTSLNSGEIDVRTVSSPLGTGERYDVADLALALGYGRQITSRFAAGLQLNYVHERIWNSTLSTVTVNAGTIYRLSERGAQLGFSLCHLGTEAGFSGRDLAIQYDEDPDEFGDNSALPGFQLTDEYPVPIIFRLGLSMPYQLGETSRLLFVADALHPNDNGESLNTGVEWRVWNMFDLRAGWQTLFQTDSALGLTLGAGLRLRGGRIQGSYAWADHDHLGGTHRFTANLVF